MARVNIPYLNDETGLVDPQFLPESVDQAELDAIAAGLADKADASTVSTLSTTVAAKANDAAVVKLTGAQTVAGAKDFTTRPTVSGVDVLLVGEGVGLTEDQADVVASAARVLGGILVDTDGETPITVEADAASVVAALPDSIRYFIPTASTAAAVQAQIDAAYDAGGGIVWLVGEHNWSAGVVVKQNVALLGYGPAVRINYTGSDDDEHVIQLNPEPGEGFMVVGGFRIYPGVAIGMYADTNGEGGYGWPRVIARDIDIIDGQNHGFVSALGNVIEARFDNIVTIRCGGVDKWGIYIGGTDNFVTRCTAMTDDGHFAEGGIFIGGGNNKIASSKAYGYVNHGSPGFVIAGAGGHVIDNCEAQDDATGYRIESQHNIVRGEADTCTVGVYDNASANQVDINVRWGGGGTAGTHDVADATGVLLGDGTGSQIRAIIHPNIGLPVSGSAMGRRLDINRDGGGNRTQTYATTWTLDAYKGESQRIRLTGPVTITPSVNRHEGQEVLLVLAQDGTGGRVVTFNRFLLTDGLVMPTDPDSIAILRLRVIEGSWTQIQPLLVLDGPASISLDFASGTFPGGQGWSTSGTWTNNGDGTITATTDATATIDLGRESFAVSILTTARPVDMNPTGIRVTNADGDYVEALANGFAQDVGAGQVFLATGKPLWEDDRNTIPGTWQFVRSGSLVRVVTPAGSAVTGNWDAATTVDGATILTLQFSAGWTLSSVSII